MADNVRDAVLTASIDSVTGEPVYNKSVGGAASVHIASSDVIQSSENVQFFAFDLDATSAAVHVIPDTELFTSMSVYHSGGGAATLAIDGDLTELQTGTYAALTTALAASTVDKHTAMTYSQIKFTSDAGGTGTISVLVVLRGGQ